MNQVVLGAAIPYCIAAIIYGARKAHASTRLLVLTPLTMAACAIWAIVPDIPRALRMDALYHRLANDPRTNIFLMHYTIDQMETDSILYTVAFLLMAISLFVVAWREVARAERSREVSA